MPSSLQAQMTRKAISPRFAIRIFLNMSSRGLAESGRELVVSASSGTDREEGISVLHRLPALLMDLDDLPGDLRLDLVHELHGFDDAQHLPHVHVVSQVDVGGRLRIGCPVEGADD